MIYVNGELLLGPSHSTDALHNIVSLLANQDLLKFSKAFRTKQVQTITYASSSSTAQFAEGRIGVYIMQKEFAFVDPSKVDFVGTDTAIASIGVIIRNRRTGMITIAHFDSFASVDQGFDQIIESMSADYQTDDKMDVYLIGAVDYPPDVNNPPEIDLPLNLCAMIVETLKKRRENFHIQLFQVLKNNTLLYADYGKPIFHGFKMETSNGTVLPARFDASSRIPAEDLRRARNIVINKMTTTQLNQHLHRVYHDEDDTFVFDPFSWYVFSLT